MAKPADIDVLIVEDEVELLEELVELFRLRGHMVRGAGRADDAIAALHELSGPVLVLSDFRLPGPSGVDLLTTLSRNTELRGKVCRFIIMTGQSDFDNEMERLIRRHRASVLFKPVSVSDLLPLAECGDPIDWGKEENGEDDAS